jgi:hypothetical protein
MVIITFKILSSLNQKQRLLTDISTKTNHFPALPCLEAAKRSSKVKHVTESRQNIIKLFMRGTYFSQSCPYCKMKKRSLRNEYNAKIFFVDKPMTPKEKEIMLNRKKKETEKLRK